MEHSPITTEQVSNVTSMEHSPITTEQVSNVTSMEHSQITTEQVSNVTAMEHSPKTTEQVSNVTAMERSPITTEQVSRLIAKTLNWKASGPDGINNFWIKRFTVTHSYLAHYFNQFMEDAGNIQDSFSSTNNIPTNEKPTLQGPFQIQDNILRLHNYTQRVQLKRFTST
jgi:Asp-tRNA(Asn)/Glu-tRNA(Gln) amidotransferase C subunit